MELFIKKFKVKDIIFCEESKYEDNVLYINKQHLISTILEGINDYKVDIDIALPGDSTRIVHIMDTVIPSYKISQSTFPGWLSESYKAGQGIMHQLDGITVMQTAQFPGVQEGIVDMKGEGSKYSAFSKKINIVITIEVINKEINKKHFAYDTKMIILKAAEYLAELTKDSIEDNLEIYKLKEKNKNLPNVGYIYYIQAQGNLRNVHIYGENNEEMDPRYLHPNEIMDNALISANYIIACQKNPTYFHQNNPVIQNLYQRDGKELNFGGVIISTESSKLEEKQKNSQKIAELAKEVGFDGVIITQEGGGHADVDLMSSLEACENLGIKAVIQTNEIAGIEGDLPPLVSYSNMADAIITNGNNDQVVKLDKMDKAIGGKDILNGKFDSKDEITTSLGIIYTSTNQLGVNKMKTVSY